MPGSMIDFVERYFVARDDRGVLEGLVNFGAWGEFNFIRSEKGVVRGNHYHKNTEEAFIILAGRLLVRAQRVVDGKLEGEVEEHLVEKGRVFLVHPMIFHSFTTLTDAEWINALSPRLDQRKPDIHRL